MPKTKTAPETNVYQADGDHNRGMHLQKSWSIPILIYKSDKYHLVNCLRWQYFVSIRPNKAGEMYDSHMTWKINMFKCYFDALATGLQVRQQVRKDEESGGPIIKDIQRWTCCWIGQ